MVDATGNPFSDDVISRYIYGNNGKPSNLNSETIITRADGAETAISRSDYMAGPGRFASPAFFELVRKFFSLSNNAMLALVEEARDLQ